jgi:CHASE3 domain sensor protein
MLKLNFRTQVLTGFAISIILVFIVGIFSYRSITQLQNNQLEVEKSQQIITASRNVLQHLVDAETGMRGYVATAKPKFLDPYNASLPRINTNLNKLEDLVEDEPQQQSNVSKLVELTNTQLGLLKINVEKREELGLETMVARNMLSNGKNIMDQIRNTITGINVIENKLLQQGRAKTEEAATATIATIGIGSAIFLVIIIVLFFYIQQTFDQQKKIEAEIKNANAELAEVLAENENKNWLLTGMSRLSDRMQGQQTEKELTTNVLTKLCRYTEAVTGTLYLYDKSDEELELYAYHAFHDVKAVKNKIKLSEGWVGQVAKDQQAATIKGRLNDKLQLETSIVSQELAEILIVPFFMTNN